MNVTTPTAALAAAVKACSPAISTRPRMPILAGVLLTAAETQLAVRAFDFETDIASRVNARVEAAGVALVSHRLLTQILSVATAATVNLTLEGARVVLTAGRATWRLPVMTADAYPAQPATGTALGAVDGAAFRDAVERVAPAAADLPAPDLPLNVIHLDFETDTLGLVATNKYRLHTARIPWTPGPVADPDLIADRVVLVDAGQLASIARHVDDGPLSVGLDLNRLTLGNDDTTVTTALAATKNGQWVTWRALLAVNPDELIQYRFDRAELLIAIKQAVTVADVQTNTKARYLTVTVTTDEALIRAASAHDGDSAVPCPVQGFTGDEPLEWVGNAEYIAQAVLAADTDPVQFAQKSPKMPIAIGPVGEAPTQIVMPIRKAQ